MKPAFRLSALMQMPVKYIWTHDAFRVGEDGPTHQPIEHEAQLRLLEKMQNHAGKMSMLALRPADAAETSVAWKMAMENTETPTALVLSRQNINDLPAVTDRYTEALKAEKGAYIVQKNGENPKVILIASGSEWPPDRCRQVVTRKKRYRFTGCIGYFGRFIPSAADRLPGRSHSGLYASFRPDRRFIGNSGRIGRM